MLQFTLGIVYSLDLDKCMTCTVIIAHKKITALKICAPPIHLFPTHAHITPDNH